MVSKTSKRFLVKFIFLIMILFALLYSISLVSKANTAKAGYENMSAKLSVTESVVLNFPQNSNETYLGNSKPDGKKNNDLDIHVWIAFGILPLLLLWLVVSVKKGNLRRETRKAMIDEKINYYGLDKKTNSLFKIKATLFSLKEVDERIRYNREKRKEERRRLLHRSKDF